MEAVADLNWPYKLLSPEYHGRLVENIDEIAAIAGVAVDDLDRSMYDAGCAKTEIDWVKSYPTLKGRQKGGLIMSGEFNPPPQNRLAAMAAAFIRNYVDARVLCLAHLVPKEDHSTDDIPNPTVLIIPDFCHGNPLKPGRMMPHWQAQRIYGLLVERFTQRRATVMHVDSLVVVEKEYGKSFLDFLQENWDVIKTK